MESTSTSLIHFDAARLAIEQAHTIDEVKDIADKAEALRQYARQARFGLEMQNRCAEIKLRAQRRTGEMLADPTQARQQGLSRTSPEMMSSLAPTLKELGIGVNQSVAWKCMARIPEKVWEEHLQRILRAANELTTKAMVRMAREWERRQEREEAIIEAPPDSNIITGDFREADNIEPNSIDLIFTDPPYDLGSIGLYRDLSQFAATVLRPGGLLLTYAGQAHIPKVHELLGTHLEYMWMFLIRHTGGELRFRKYHIHNAWKPIFAYYKLPLTAWWDWLSDVASGGKEKRGHDWQQAEAEAAYFIEAFCPIGGIMIDPLCGSGTSLAAAKRLGRNYLGFEIDEATADYARKRLSEI